MSLATRVVGFLRRHPLIAAPAFVAVALLSVISVNRMVLRPKLAGVPLPIPVFDIESVSGTHTASLLNLPVGQPGVAPQPPNPVDVDGDLIPDVLVSVNLIDAAGLFNNPPDVNKIIAPNIVIERVVKGVPLGSSPPLRINIKLRIKDSDTAQPDTILRFGYDTAQGGSIPQSFRAVLNGLQDFFNPLEAVVDTKGGLLNNADTPFIFYEGPLTLIAGIEQASFKADAELAYKPFPDAVRVRYLSDDDGQHFQYAHGIGNEVHLKYGTDVNGSNVRYIPGDLPDIDLNTKLKIKDGAHLTDLNARVDRMPRSVKLDMKSDGTNAGSADYQATADGRLPDVQLDVVDVTPGQRPLNATLNLDGLPQVIHAKWSLPTDAPASATFDASGAGLRAVQADIRNYNGSSPVIPGFVPAQQQFLNFQQVGAAAAPGPDRRITARVERIRHLAFAQSATGGIDFDANVGDGELPLQAHFLTDDRSGTKGSLLDGTAVVSPLPDAAHVAFTKPADPKKDPLIVTYEASEAVDVDGRAEMRDAVAGPNCGDKGTLCASLAARNVPSKVVTTVLDLEHEMHIDIDSTLRPSGAQPDFFADAQLGQDDNVPLIAHAELLGAPAKVRILTHEGADQTLDRAEFHACDFNFTTNVCAPGTDGPDDEVGALAFNVRNWVTRPADLPPPSEATPSFASVVARGGADPHNVLFEAAGRITDIREVDYRNTGGVAGVRTRVGGGKPFSVHADFGNIAFKPDDPALILHRFDVLADVNVPTLPDQLDVCFRQADPKTIAPLSNTFTAPCETQNPFGDASNLTASPLTFAYRASALFDVLATGKVVDRGVGANNTAVGDDHTIAATANVYNLPKKLTLDVQAPEKGKDGPIRALFRTQEPSDPPRDPSLPQIKVDADFQQYDADLVCKDPRVPGVGDQVMCIRAQLKNLPESALVKYDPTLESDNFHVLTAGAQVMDILGFNGEPKAKISIVKRHQTTFSTGKLNPVKGIVLLHGTADVLVAEGTIKGIPRKIDGTLLLPSTVDVRADPPLKNVDLTVQNFIAPDPLPQSLPGTRAGIPVADQTVTFVQRADHFRADVHVGDLTGAAYASAADANGKLLDTKSVRVNFGPGHTIRAYADLESLADETDPSSLQQIIADVTLPNVPQGLNVCFRGPKDPSGGTPTVNTFCDLAPQDNEGAFSFVTDPGATGNLLDVNAFIRVAKSGGQEVLAARADMLNVPKVVQGTYAKDGKITFAGFETVNGSGFGQNPDGIDQIKFDVANFDAEGASGFANPVPWDFGNPGDIVGFPADLGGQQVRLRVTNSFLRAVGTLGDVGATGNLQSVLLDKTFCPAPPNAPNDYATYFPSAPPTGTTFTCIRANFDPGGSPNPLRADIAVDKDGKHLAFNNGGFDRLPDWVQLTLAKAPTQDASGKFLDVCGPAIPAQSHSHCIPPLIRMDSAPNVTANVSGIFEVGTPGDLGTLDGATANGPMVDLKAIPPLVLANGNNWSNWSANPHGARLRMQTFKGAGGETRIALRAGLRLEVPKSLTVDQVQSWDGVGPSGSGEETGDEGKDIRFHYIVRDGNGAVTGSIGEAAGLLALDGGKQILLTGDDPTFIHGFDIPGDVGLGVYLRHHKRAEDSEGSDVVDKLFAQIDGRLNQPLTARARVTTDGTLINALVQHAPAYPVGDTSSDPSFRLRFEMDKNKEKGLSKALCFIICIITDVKAKALDARFDFAPNGANAAAHRVDATVELDGPKVAMDAKGFGNVFPSDNSPAEISADVGARLDPMNIFIHAGIPVLGSFDMVLISDLRAGVTIDRANRFRLTDNLLHLKAKHEGTGTNSHVDIEFNPRVLAGALTSIFGIFVGNPILYDFVFLPPSPPRALVSFAVCPFPLAITDINSISLGAGEDKNLYGWLQNPPEVRFITDGAFGLFDLVGKLISPVFCAVPADLIDRIPAAPFDFAAQSHGVPDAPPPPPPPTPVTPPPPPELHLTTGSTAMCGDKIYTKVLIDAGATLQVSNSAGPECLAADVGTLRLASQGDLTVNGTVLAAPGSTQEVTLTAKHLQVASGGFVQATRGPVNLLATERVDINGGVDASGIATGTTGGTAATGNSGAGHGGAGGVGGSTSPGTGGTPYGDGSVAPVQGVVPSENGSVGAGPGTPGAGGGVIRIAADRVRVDGTVIANGLPGSDGDTLTGTDCADPNALPNPKPNTGIAGAGGGSGGGIVMAGTAIDLTGGFVEARGAHGGRGTAGGGGGGGGGIIKVISPILTGSPSVLHGDGGLNGCVGDPGIGNGADGADGQIIRHAEPTSQALVPDAYPSLNQKPLWNKGAGFKVPVHGAVADAPPNNHSFVLVACGSHRPPEASENTGDKNFGIDVPTSNSLDNPCGPNAGDSGVSELGRITVNGQETGANATVTPTSTMGEGFWGLYTVAVKTDGVAPNDCYNRTDNLLFNSGFLYDLVNCHVEDVPGRPDSTVAIDNTAPTVAVNFPGLASPPKVKTQDVTIGVTASDVMNRQTTAGTIGLSGLAAIECSNDNATWKPCQNGEQGWRLDGGSGAKTVYVRAFDIAGNPSAGTVSAGIELDTTTPTSDARVIVPDPIDGANNFYISSPTFRIDSFDDGGSPPPATQRFKWWIDSGAPGFCDNDCDVPTDLGDGTHKFHWQARDALGNEEAVRTKTVKIDRNDPQSALLTAPDAADGTNGWFVRDPFVVISAVDRAGGSGLVNKPSDPVNNNAGIFYRVDGGAVQGPIVPRNFDPFQLHAGPHDVCWRVVDVSGRSDVASIDSQCRHFNVDLTNPSTTLTPAGTTGGNGWYRSLVSVTAAASDATPGSGVDKIFVSVDVGPFLQYSGVPLNIGEGLHRVRAFSVDVSGRRSTTIELPLKVDLSPTVTSLRLMPAEPAVNGWFRTKPKVVLRAVDGDQNSGLALLRYKVDKLDAPASVGSFATYTEPFQLGQGLYQVTTRTIDAAGNIEDHLPVPVNVDLTPPVAKALSPSPIIWSKLLGGLGLLPPTNKLNFSVSDNLSHQVRIFAIVYDEFGAAARRIDGGLRNITPGQTYNGYVEWDGKDQTLTGLVGVGIYHYRIIAIDEAGNRTQTGESKPLQIKLL